MSKEYIVVLPVEPIQHRQTFLVGESLPLHCTLMHWFRLGHGRPSILDKGIARLALEAKFEEIELVSDRAELFGPNGDVPVHVLARDEQLNLLHTKLFKFLAITDSLPEELRWVGAGYRPHVTDTKWRQFPPGTRHRPTSLALIERNQARERIVTATYILGGPPF